MLYVIFFLSIFILDIPNITQTETFNIAYIVAMFLLLFEIIKKRLVIYKPSLILILGMVILSLIGIMLKELEIIKIIRFLKFISFYLFFILGYAAKIKKNKLLKILNYSLFIFYSIIFLQNYEKFVYSLFNSLRILSFDFLSISVESGNVTPTFYILVMYYLYINRKLLSYNEQTVIVTINLIITFIITITSYSRTAILLGLFIIIFNLLLEKKLFNKIKIYFILILLTSGVIFSYNYNFLDIQSNSIVRRFEYTFIGSRTGDVLDDSTIARLDTFASFMEIITDNFIFGTGFDRPIGEEIVTGLTSAHNGFISYLYKMGILVTLLYLANLFIINNKLIKNDKRYLGILIFIIIGNLPQELFNYISFYQFYYFIIGFELSYGGFLANGKN